MPRKLTTSEVPLSGGMRRSEPYTDPFFGTAGELTRAKNGKFTQEGGFQEHGGTSKVSSSAFAGTILWMKRWYRGEGQTNPWFVFTDDGTDKFMWVTVSDPTATSVTFSRLDDWTLGSGTPIPTGDLSEANYFTTAAVNGWFFIKSDSTTGNDEFFACVVDGSTVKAFLVGAAAPGTAPTLLTPAGGTNITAGNYRFRNTYVYGWDGEGDVGESNATGASLLTAAVAGDQFDITVVQSARPDVRAIRIYRQLVNDAPTDPYWLIEEVANVSGSYTSTIADAELSFANTQLEEDHDPTPNTIRSISAAKGRLWGVEDGVRNRIHFSIVNQPYVMPNVPTYYSDELNLESGPVVTGTFQLEGRPFVTSVSGIWALIGENPGSFFWQKIPNSQGYVAERSIAEGDGLIWGLGSSDWLVFDGLKTMAVSKVRGIVGELDETLIGDSIGTFRDHRYYCGVQKGAPVAGVYNTLVHIQREPAPGSPQGFATSLVEGEVGDITNPDTFQFTAIDAFLYERDRIFLAMTDNHIYQFDVGTDWALTGTAGGGSEFDLQTIWTFPAGPYAQVTFHKMWVAISSEGAGGNMQLSWEIMDDDLTAFKEGSTTFDLLPGAGEDDMGVYNFSRYG